MKTIPSTDHPRTLVHAPWFAPTALFVLTLAVRIIPWNRPLMGIDEWILANISVRVGLWALPAGELYDVLVPTGYPYPPFQFWVGGLLVYLLDTHPIVLRLPTILADAGAVALVFMIGRRAGGAFSGWAAGLLAWSTLYLSFQNTVSLDFMMVFWILLSFYLYLRSADSKDLPVLLAAVLASGMACFSKFYGVVYHAVLCTMVVAMPQSRSLVRGKRFLVFCGAAMALPALILALDGLTWRLYGFEKTHLGEVMRQVEWVAYAADPVTGEIIHPRWHYYFEYCWVTLGWPVCLLIIAGIVAVLRERRREQLLCLIIAVIWFAWATATALKNPRYLLVAVYFFYVCSGVVVQQLARSKPGKTLAVGILAAVVVFGVVGTGQRLNTYLTEVGVHEAVYDVINTQTPEAEVVFSESRSFEEASMGDRWIRRTVVGPYPGVWEDGLDYVVADDRFYDLLCSGALDGVSATYLADRERIMREWQTLYDASDRDVPIRVLKRP